MKGLRAAFVFATADRYLTATLSILTTVVVSRLVSPREFGIAVIGGSALAIAGAVRDVGSSAYIVQNPALTNQKLRAVFTINLAVTTLMICVLFTAAPWLAYVFETPGLDTYVRVATIAFFTGVIVFPLHGLLARDLAFRKIAIVNVASALTNSAMLLLFVTLELSFLSFALADAASAIVGMLILVYLRPQFSIFRPSFAAWRDVLSFSLFSSGTVLLHRAAEGMSLIVLGALLNPAAVGLLRRASLICDFPAQTIMAGVNAVALPAFSEQSRQSADLAKSYVGTVERVTAVLWPCLGLLILLAHPTILLLLGGGEWLRVVPLVQIMAGAFFMNFAAGLNYSLMFAVGAVQKAFFLAATQVGVGLPIIALAAQYGLDWVAWSLYAIIGINALISTMMLHAVVQFSWRCLWRAMMRSLSVALSALVGPTVLALANGGLPTTGVDAVSALLLASVGWLTGLRLLHHPVWFDLGGAWSASLTRMRKR